MERKQIEKMISENLEFKEMNPHLKEDIAENLGFSVDRIIESSNRR